MSETMPPWVLRHHRILVAGCGAAILLVGGVGLYSAVEKSRRNANRLTDL